jgi:hypothetical protein
MEELFCINKGRYSMDMEILNGAANKQSYEEVKKSGVWVKNKDGYIWKYKDSSGADMIYGQIKDAGYVKNQKYHRFETSDKTTFSELKDAKKYELDTYTYERLKKDGYVE